MKTEFEKDLEGLDYSNKYTDEYIKCKANIQGQIKQMKEMLDFLEDETCWEEIPEIRNRINFLRKNLELAKQRGFKI